MKAPFPYFGGKSRIAGEVWARFGDPQNYVEPFCGSAAVLLARPTAPRTETINDLDCYLTNFWRAVRAEPETVAQWADWPVSELDQNARHRWLMGRAELRENMNTDPDWYDAKAAGWWVYGANTWIGGGWCSLDFAFDEGDAGMGIHRQLPHLGNAGMGIHRQLPHLGNAGMGIHDWLCALQERLRRVRIACGDWQRVLTPSVTEKHGLTAVFLDPPYLTENNGTYATGNGGGVALEVRGWALEHGDEPNFRIALCGYEGEHDMPAGWECVAWRQRKGYQRVENGKHSGHLERIWFSPHCLRPQENLFSSVASARMDAAAQAI